MSNRSNNHFRDLTKMTNPINPRSKAATARAKQRAKAAESKRQAEARHALLAEMKQRAEAALTKDEIMNMRMHPHMARIYAIDLAERARIYAWSDRIEYTIVAARALDKLIRETQYAGFDMTAWRLLQERMQPVFDGIRHTITARLHLACRDIIKSQYSDNIELRTWALAAQVALQAEKRIDSHYTKLCEQRLHIVANVDSDEPIRAAISEALAVMAGARLEEGDLDSHVNETTNYILSIKP